MDTENNSIVLEEKRALTKLLWSVYIFFFIMWINLLDNGRAIEINYYLLSILSATLVVDCLLILFFLVNYINRIIDNRDKEEGKYITISKLSGIIIVISLMILSFFFGTQV